MTKTVYKTLYRRLRFNAKRELYPCLYKKLAQDHDLKGLSFELQNLDLSFLSAKQMIKLSTDVRKVVISKRDTCYSKLVPQSKTLRSKIQANYIKYLLGGV